MECTPPRCDAGESHSAWSFVCYLKVHKLAAALSLNTSFLTNKARLLLLCMQCEFPSLGTLLHNRAGRIEFVFHPLVMEHFEREHYALIKEMEQAGVDSPLQQAMQRMGLHTPVR